MTQIPHFKTHILYLGHFLAMQLHLTVFDNLQLFLARRDLFSAKKITMKRRKSMWRQRIQQALTTFSLINQCDTITGTLSAGQQRRLVLSTLLLTPAPFWLLDEPFTALDQSGMQLIIRLMRIHLQRQGYLLMSSHQLIDDLSFFSKNFFYLNRMWYSSLCSFIALQFRAEWSLLCQAPLKSLYPFCFLMLAVSLFPISLGADAVQIGQIAVPVFWILQLFLVTLSFEELFQEAWQAGLVSILIDT